MGPRPRGGGHGPGSTRCRCWAWSRRPLYAVRPAFSDGRDSGPSSPGTISAASGATEAQLWADGRGGGCPGARLQAALTIGPCPKGEMTQNPTLAASGEYRGDGGWIVVQTAVKTTPPPPPPAPPRCRQKTATRRARCAACYRHLLPPHTTPMNDGHVGGGHAPDAGEPTAGVSGQPRAGRAWCSTARGQRYRRHGPRLCLPQGGHQRPPSRIPT